MFGPHDLPCSPCAHFFLPNTRSRIGECCLWRQREDGWTESGMFAGTAALARSLECKRREHLWVPQRQPSRERKWTGGRPSSPLQVHLESLASLLGLSERVEGGASNSDCRFVRVDGPPRGNKARLSVKPRTRTAFVAHHERKPAAARHPYFEIIDWGVDASKLQGQIFLHILLVRKCHERKPSALSCVKSG